MKIREELEKLSKVSRRQFETKQDYFVRLTKAVDEALGPDDSIWNTLSAPSKSWFNEAVLCIKNKLDIKEFADEDPIELAKEILEHTKKDGVIPVSEIELGMEIQVATVYQEIYHGQVTQFDPKTLTLITITGETEIIRTPDIEIVEILTIQPTRKKEEKFTYKEKKKAFVPKPRFGDEIAKRAIEELTSPHKETADTLAIPDEILGLPPAFRKQGIKAFTQEQKKEEPSPLVAVSTRPGGRPRSLNKAGNMYKFLMYVLENKEATIAEATKFALDSKMSMSKNSIVSLYFAVHNVLAVQADLESKKCQK